MRLDIGCLISEESLYRLISPEQIFEYYLGVTISSKLIVNPLRKDRKPTAKFCYVDGNLIFKDFAWRGFNAIQCVMQKETLSRGEALLRIYNDLIATPTPTFKTSKQTLQELQNKKVGSTFRVSLRAFTEEELAFWRIGGLEITEELLNSYGIFAVEHLHEEEYTLSNLSFAFAYIEGGVVNQIYFPKNKALGKRRFRSKSGFMVGGTQWLDESEEYLVITKSRKDALYLTLMGVNACYVIHEKILLDPRTFFKLTRKYKRVFTLFDQDYTGRRLSVAYMWKYKTTPLLFSCEGNIKDFSECLEVHEETYCRELIKSVKQKLKL